MHRQIDVTSIGAYEVFTVDLGGVYSTEFKSGPNLLFSLAGVLTEADKKLHLGQFLAPSPEVSQSINQISQRYPDLRFFYEEDDGELIDTPWHVDYDNERESFATFQDLLTAARRLYRQRDHPGRLDKWQ